MDKPIKYKYLRLFIYSIFWAIFWLSINTMPFEIYLFGESFVKSLNSLRLLSALVVSLLLLLILIYNFFFKNFKLALKKNNLKILFLLLFLTYSFSFALDNSRNFNLDNLYLIILSLGTIFVYFLIKFEKEEQFKNFIKINIFFLCIICIVIVTPKIDQLIINNFNFYYAFAPLDGNILDQVNPRITGLSRTFAILSIFLFVIFINLKNKYLKFFLFFIFLITSFLILSMQSRGTILCFYVSIFFLILFIDKSKILLKSILILTIIISNILFIELYLNKDQSLKEKTNQSRLLKKNTSGRIDIWNYTLKNYNYKNIFGYGSQGDRFFLEKYENNINYGTNSSNAILYAFLSGGYLAVILMIFIYFNLMRKILRAIFLSKNDDIYYNFSLSIIVFFIIRSIFENSFALLSIDYLLIFSSIIYIEFIEIKKSNQK